MTRKLSSALALATFIAGGAASAQTSPADGGRIYLGFGLGGSYVTDDDFEGTDTLPRESFPDGIDFSGPLEIDWGTTGNVFVGYRVSERFSLEIESSAWGGEVRRFGDDFAARTLLSLNAVVWGDQASRFVPYAGVGLGYSSFYVDDSSYPDTDGALGYKLKGGAIMPFGRAHAVGLEASFASGGDFTVEESEFVEIEQAFDAVGLALTYRYQFGGYPGR